jgi:4-oxalocrotonate tautomerase
MPYVNVRITKTGVTAAQKAEIIKGVTDVLVRTLGKNPERTFVVIDEVDFENWGIGGESIAARRTKGK